MPHLLKEYAKSLGVKISKPIFKDHFFPLEFDKYIVIYNEDSTHSRNYKYFNIVLHILRPLFHKHNIKVVQLGSANHIEGVNKTLNLPLKQQAYIISKSMLYVGCDGVLSQIANFKRIPSVNIYGNIYKSLTKPLLGDSSKVIDLEPEWDKNPCFAPQDPKRQINFIKPELIAQSILKLIKIEKLKVNFKTLQAGHAFGNPAIEIVPTSFHNIEVDKNYNIFIRADYGLDMDSLKKYCATHKSSLFFDFAIDMEQLMPYKSNIKEIFIFVDEDSDKIDSEYFENLNILNIKYTILVKNIKSLPKIQNQYFDYNIQTYNIDSSKNCVTNHKSKFFTKKKILKDGKVYASAAHMKKNLDNDDRVIDIDEFWQESQQFFIYEQS